MNQFFESLKSGAVAGGTNLVSALIALAIGLVVIKIIMITVRKAFEKSKMERAFAKFLAGGVKFLLVFVLIFIVAEFMGIPSSMFLALTSVAGVAISLSLQGILSNFASGILQLSQHRFKEGDYVKVGSAEGTVKAVDFISTTLVTPDNKIIYVPNSMTSNNEFTNFTTNDIRRVDLTVSVSYDSDIDEVKALLNDILDKQEHTLNTPARTVGLLEMAESSLNFAVRAYVPTDKYWEVYFNLNETIFKALKARNIEIPFNQLDVHVVNGN